MRFFSTYSTANSVVDRIMMDLSAGADAVFEWQWPSADAKRRLARAHRATAALRGTDAAGGEALFDEAVDNVADEGTQPIHIVAEVLRRAGISDEMAEELAEVYA